MMKCSPRQERVSWLCALWFNPCARCTFQILLSWNLQQNLLTDQIKWRHSARMNRITVRNNTEDETSCSRSLHSTDFIAASVTHFKYKGYLCWASFISVYRKKRFHLSCSSSPQPIVNHGKMVFKKVTTVTVNKCLLFLSLRCFPPSFPLFPL